MYISPTMILTNCICI